MTDSVLLPTVHLVVRPAEALASLASGSEQSKHLSTTLGRKGEIERVTNSVKCLSFHAIYPLGQALNPRFPQLGFQDEQLLKQPFKGILGC